MAREVKNLLRLKTFRGLSFKRKKDPSLDQKKILAQHVLRQIPQTGEKPAVPQFPAKEEQRNPDQKRSKKSSHTRKSPTKKKEN